MRIQNLLTLTGKHILNATIIGASITTSLSAFLMYYKLVLPSVLFIIVAFILFWKIYKISNVSDFQTSYALDNMPMGLCMFNANKELVLCNDSYVEMYRLPADLKTSGSTHNEIIAHRIESGLLSVEKEDSAVENKLNDLDRMSKSDISQRIDTLTDGRSICVTRKPMAGGGWVATHEDVTEQQKLISQKARSESIESAIASFRERIECLLKSVGESTSRMKSTASELHSVSDQSSGHANEIGNGSQEYSKNAGLIADAATELTVSITDISGQVSQTHDIVRNAVAKADSSNESFDRLAAQVRKIGDVVKLIKDIAEQTNLLALNATIEAARAGEAGRGFAVVASEVKSLAIQTASATEEVSSQISEVQASTSSAVQAISIIKDLMSDLESYTTEVSASISQQAAATEGISNNISTASTGSNKIAESLDEFKSNADKTSKSADVVLTATYEVESAIENLQKEVESFLSNVAA